MAILSVGLERSIKSYWFNWVQKSNLIDTQTPNFLVWLANLSVIEPTKLNFNKSSEMVVLTFKASLYCSVFWKMIAVIIIPSMSYILGEAVWSSCQCVRCADQRSPDSPRFESHSQSCLYNYRCTLHGRHKKSKFMKFLPVWIRNFLLMSLYLDYLSLFLRRDWNCNPHIYRVFINSESRRACDEK